MVAVFPVLGKPTAAIEPGDGALDDPTLGFDDKAFGMISAFDDLNHQATHGFGGAVVKHRPCVRAIGEQFAQERKLTEQRGHQADAAVAVLNIGGGHQRVQHQAQCIDKDVTLLALDQLARVEAMRIDAGAPFSALLTLWLSITQAVGLASCSACSRHLT